MLYTDLPPAHVDAFNKDGFVIVKNFCEPLEVQRLYTASMQDKVLDLKAMEVQDASGRSSRLSLWFNAGDNVFGYLARSERMINSVYQLLDSDGPVCLFHTKIIRKEPWVGGAWEWHQDYGYWYKNQFMFPDQLMSVMVALQPETKANGCLQVIKGSHKLGRIDHHLKGGQVSADTIMVKNALNLMELTDIELEAGDALFFHSNLLHSSGPNVSDNVRCSIIFCFSSETNIAFNEKSSSWRTPVSVVPDEAILQWKSYPLIESDFLQRKNDPALSESAWQLQ